MLVVATTSNYRGEIPTLDMKDMMSSKEVSRNAQWFPTFKRNCRKVAVTGKSWHSLVSIRGSLFESVNYEFDEIRVGGIRCPIHRIDKVCNLGNKTVVDLVVALDPTGIEHKWSGWTFDIDFPPGFTPMCYVSKSAKLEYLAIVFESIGVMAVDVTPISYTLIWDIAEKCRVDLDSKTVAEGQCHKLEVLNATPGQRHVVEVKSEVSDLHATVEVETPPMTAELMRKFYLSRKDDKGVFDLEGVNSDTVSYLRKAGILKSGHRVRVRRPSTGPITVSVVISGDTFSLGKGGSLYVVPDFSVDEGQFICLQDESHQSHVVEFDKSESYVKYNDCVYPHGTTFTVASQQISVVKGSIILVVEDEIATFPGGSSAAAQIMKSGDLVVRDLLMRNSSQVEEKVDGETTYGRNSFHIYNPVDDTTTECTRVSHGLNDAGDTGSVSIGVLYTDSNSDQTVVTTISSDPTTTSISSRDQNSPEVVTATFNTGGLSFDSDNGNIYFGADKDFRIHFEDQSGLDPAMLQVQSKATDASYVTRFLITAAPP